MITNALTRFLAPGLLALAITCPAHALFVFGPSGADYEFTGGGLFENTVATDTIPDAGDTPSVFTDPDTLVGFHITNVSIVGDGSPNLDEGNGLLGVDNGTFGDGEQWTFEFDTDMQFDGIQFNNFGTGETFLVQSDGWIGLSFTPGDPANVSFNSTTGEFTLNFAHPANDFDLNDLTGGVLLSVATGTDVTFAAGSSSTVQLAGFSVTAVVPEPTSAALLLGGTLLMGLRRSRRRA